MIPIVVYHGPRCWSGPTRLREMIEPAGNLGNDFERMLLALEFRLVDLSHLDDEQIERSPLSPRGRLVLLLLEHVRHVRNILRFVGGRTRLIADLYADPDGSPTFRTFVMCVLGVRDDADPDRLAGQVGRRAEPLAGEDVMSIARRLGEQGKIEGREERARAVFLRLLERRFGPVPAGYSARIAGADLATVVQWTDRILEVDSAEQLLGD